MGQHGACVITLLGLLSFNVYVNERIVMVVKGKNNERLHNMFPFSSLIFQLCHNSNAITICFKLSAPDSYCRTGFKESI